MRRRIHMRRRIQPESTDGKSEGIMGVVVKDKAVSQQQLDTCVI
jgi:hypothetical protein